ncbi:hypothetical protein ONZ51_g1420 [Trametes cubensis]|uniref:Uncharacterized protein n=1 Tax=Trametes cubensis TaxID=1111947 RepID=A0AAD7U1M7_9APHY|nr:hypothetical protein ONZ51_g1420 [Trametes cubensis]
MRLPVYSVSLLATLNARAGLRAQVDVPGHPSALSPFADLLQRITPLPLRLSGSSPLQRRPSSYMWNQTPSRLIVVAVQRDTVITFDYDEEVDATEDDHKDKATGTDAVTRPPSAVNLGMYAGHTETLHPKEQTDSCINASQRLSNPDAF